ncbi:hypothetical protein A3C57_02300 [Candidatus Nomurabacteria bacterium RIFCSPHIGHO2_02_FULL_33_12]|uniref:tRNA/rRNA methyltransferase SpoU type domain-containing protein n=1 Tax=Candidatus Nomurabacteria bacterium RIFCSPLOWO2_01_FULL_33_17 TaxID=1801764 RepID=A0A1F6WMN3_9BACT|nr:MAG: hypothetical protein A3C57_02300 [Candidatus Nomurabacteria bacterium RIFCSPHIGHO2_02_FULL_33_12]OGI83137.1 MAG: hypothetical protein A2903_01570 [Candidatus Nomurabacteria bacterium RIFCSPLOWO2_01_FULL_33_17]
MKIPQNKPKDNPIPSRTSQITLIALDIRSSENVGSFFRTADAVGVEHIYLVGYTPNPIDKFGKADGKIAKTALGAEKTIPYSKHKTITPLLKKLKKDGFTILALEQAPNSVDYKNILNVITRERGKTSLKQTEQGESFLKLVLIVGNEVVGIQKSVLKQVDYVMEIPMRGMKESLNVSVATGVALYELTRIW